MPGTLLLMDLGAQEQSVDLSEMTRVVLSDPGATIQILREAGREGSFGEERPSRIEDCISVLGVQACIEVVSRRTVSRATDKTAIMKTWSHAREIAEACRVMANEMLESVGPNEAYLTGLLHELGSLPAILGWQPAFAVSSDPVLAGLKIAEEWFLPQCVVDYFSELGKLKTTSVWTRIVQRAHEVTGSTSEGGQFDSAEELPIPANWKS
jgi:HD-like signal output (HDOD) protein